METECYQGYSMNASACGLTGFYPTKECFECDH